MHQCLPCLSRNPLSPSGKFYLGATLPGLWLGAALFLGGCSSAPVAGTHPSQQPPRIVITEQGTKRWDRPGAFGPVPPELLQLGREQCATLNHSGKTHVPVGYHPHAETFEGYPFEDGGFFCQQK